MSKNGFACLFLLFICLISLSSAYAEDINSSDVFYNLDSSLDFNLDSNSNFDLGIGLDSNINSNFNANLNNISPELGLSPKNFKGLSSNSPVGGGQIGLFI